MERLSTRRSWLQGGLAALGGAWASRFEALGAQPSAAPSTALRVDDLSFPEHRRLAGVARVLSHAQGAATGRCLVLLHGLGESHDPQLALRAWSDLYGLASAHTRLAAPPVTADPKLRYLSAEHAAELNAGLSQNPYRGLVLVCPQTPRPAAFASRSQMFDEFAAWLGDVLLPAVEQRWPGCTRRVGLDGCSMGGYVATEVVLRSAQRFSSFGMVQSALSRQHVERYASGLKAALGTRVVPIHLQTSTRDPFLAVTQQLSAALTRHALPHELRVLPGPHDQPWLREVGSLEMLRWHDRNL